MASESIVWGSLVGDAISLGPHWIYDTQEIARQIDRPDQFHDPISAYHPGKKAGDLTHYGDQALLLLKHLAAAGTFDLEAYAKTWKAYWEKPGTISYRDGATRETLANLGAGKAAGQAGSASHDLAGASRIAPLFLLRGPDDESLIESCRNLVAFTHRAPEVVDAAGFFAKLALAVNDGETIDDALKRLGPFLENKRLAAWFAAGKESAASAKPDGEVLDEHGLSCDIDGGFAGVIHLLTRYPEDPFTAVVENAKAGGDSAARGMLLGLTYGAADLLDRLPRPWFDELSAAAEIRSAVAQLGLK